MKTLAAAISEKIEELASRFPTWRETQAVRAYLLHVVAEKSDAAIRQEISLSRRAVVWKNVRWGQWLVGNAVQSQLITMEEMRAWTREVQQCRTP